jgi:hypothetical protein
LVDFLFDWIQAGHVESLCRFACRGKLFFIPDGCDAETRVVPWGSRIVHDQDHRVGEPLTLN